MFHSNKKDGKPLDGLYAGPACPKTKIQCDKKTCFRVQNIGKFGSKSSTPKGTPIVVQIIDSCPAGHASNYCKAYNADPLKVVPSRERCGDGSTNYLDIDYKAYLTLTGAPFVENKVRMIFQKSGNMDGMSAKQIRVAVSRPT